MVDDGVRDLVCNLIGMPFRNGFGSEEVAHMGQKYAQIALVASCDNLAEIPLFMRIFALLIAKDGGTGPMKSWQPGNGPGATSNPPAGKMSNGSARWAFVCANEHLRNAQAHEQPHYFVGTGSR